MAGSYCKFCDLRCFVYRVVPELRITHWATCHMGALNDMAETGYDHTTAHNPYSGDCPCEKCVYDRKHVPIDPEISAQKLGYERDG